MDNEKAFKRNTFIVLATGLAILVFVFLNIAFPTFKYSLIDEGVSKPGVLKREIGGKHFLVVTPRYDYPYETVKLSLGSDEDFKNVSEAFPVLKDFVSQIFPLAESELTQEELVGAVSENNQTEVPNGTLFSYGEAVHFLSDGKVRSFLGPEIFRRLGFDWGEVRELRGDQFAALEKGEKIGFNSEHPKGVFLETEEGKIFLVRDGERAMVDEQDLAEVWPDFYTVKVDADEARKLGVCEVKTGSKKEVECKIKIEKDFVSRGDSYAFEVPKEIFDAVSSAEMSLSLMGSFDVTTVKESLKRAKDSLQSEIWRRYSMS